MTTKLTFLGAVGTVTGSKFLLETPTIRILVDCGLFQGVKQLRLRNWKPLPYDPKSIDAVILTHAHIDHSGYLPLLRKNGFSGPIRCTAATQDLCKILLPDSGFLQERQAEYANRRGHSIHKPALPLYTQRDAEDVLQQFESVELAKETTLSEGLSVKFLRAGHILGAAIVELQVDDMKIVFSGDLGRPNTATMVDPTKVQHADYLIVESTYGNRHHDPQDPEDALEDIINRTHARGGTVVIPSFAVGRAQTLLFHIHQLISAGRIPDLPVSLDSPMAISATNTFCKHVNDHKLSEEQCKAAFDPVHYTQTTEESKALDNDPKPKIIVSASGMATGGRILYHLKRYAPDARNTILFAGFQAGGTRGSAMLGGANSIKIHGEYYDVRAEVANLNMLSAHADADELLEWLRSFNKPPKETFIVHGEASASDALRFRIKEELGWSCTVPEHLESVDLT